MRPIPHTATALMLLVLAACGGAAPRSGGGSNSFGPANPTERSVPAPFTTHAVATLDEPWALAFLPDGRMLVTQKTGSLLLVTQAGAKAAIAGVPKVAYGGQGGLLDVALAPDWPRSHIVYLSYAEPRSSGRSLALARARFDPTAAGRPALADVRVIFRAGSDGEGEQFGGIVTFPPDGRSLFLTSGERQRKTPAQDPDQALGKILHLTLDGRPAPGNPVPNGNRVRAATWSTGHRNPYGLAFAPDGKLWEVEMGPQGGDELNLIDPGINYGWPKVSNGINYDGSPIPRHATRPDFRPPVLWWAPVISPSSLIFASGRQFPAWRGQALIGSLSAESLVRVAIGGDGQAREVARYAMGARIRGVREAPDGAIWIIEDGQGGRLLKLVPREIPHG